MNKPPKGEDFAVRRAADELIRRMRAGVQDMRIRAFEAEGFCFDSPDDGLPEVVFQTSQGLVRWKFPNWEAVLQLSSNLSQMRLGHDKALRDPMREFMASVAENKSKPGRQ